MKASKKTIIIMLVICVLALGSSICLEFAGFNEAIEVKYHIGYFENIALGIFASGLLVLIPTIVQYNIEKNTFYIEMFKYSDSILYWALEIISCMENYNQHGVVSKYFDDFGLTYNKLISRYSTFTYFYKLTKKDKLIESIINETTKFIMIQKEVLELSKKLKRNEITYKAYEESFEVVREEMKKTYKEEFMNYKIFLEKYMKDILENKILKTYSEF